MDWSWKFIKTNKYFSLLKGCAKILMRNAEYVRASCNIVFRLIMSAGATYSHLCPVVLVRSDSKVGRVIWCQNENESHHFFLFFRETHFSLGPI